MSTIYLRWPKIEKACGILAEAIRPHQVDGIVPVARGGLVPAAMIAYQLNLNIMGIYFLGERVVVIDDICDTGQTFRRLRTVHKNALFAALFVKPQGKDVCDLWAAEADQDDWLVFPWAPNDEVNR